MHDYNTKSNTVQGFSCLNKTTVMTNTGSHCIDNFRFSLLTALCAFCRGSDLTFWVSMTA
jgi:hypothetical protein